MDDKILQKIISNDFDKALETLKSEYGSVLRYNQELRQQVAEWNKDKEIQKLQNELRDCYRIPASIMKEIRDAQHKHYEETKVDKNYDILSTKMDLSGGHKDFDIIIGETYLDDLIRCKCCKCNKIIYEGWR